jgi:hypothetical protein
MRLKRKSAEIKLQALRRILTVMDRLDSVALAVHRAPPLTKRVTASLAVMLMLVVMGLPRSGPAPAPGGGGGGTYAAAPNAFYNSDEEGCDSNDANVLICENFERKADGSFPGDWYPQQCDSVNNLGGIETLSKGWCGTIYNNPPDGTGPIIPEGAVDCTGTIGAFGLCAATSGELDGGGGSNGNMADHHFPGETEYGEVFVRWYVKYSSGFSFSSPKVLTINKCCAGGAGIFWGGLGYNIAAQSNDDEGRPEWVNNHADNEVQSQNQGNNLNVTGGNWYFYEVRIKLDTNGNNDGVLSMWINNCGAALPGNCTGSPTLRMHYPAFNWGFETGDGGIGALWWENFSNNGDGDGNLGTEFYEQIKVSRVGPIGYYTGN